MYKKLIKKITSAVIAGALCIGCVNIGNMKLFKASDNLLVADDAAIVWNGSTETDRTV